MSRTTSARAGVGHGGPVLAMAQLVFLFAAYATTLALTHLVDPATLGRYNVVVRLVAVPNMVIIQTLVFAVSRPLAAQYDRGAPAYWALRRRGMRLAAVLGGLVCLVFLAGSSAIAEGLRDAELTAPIRAVAPIGLFYAFYAVNVGTLNATRRFTWQAALDVFLAAAKAALIVLAAFLGLGLALTLAGFTLSSVMALVFSIFVVWRIGSPPAAGERDPAPSIAGFAGVLVLFTATTSLLLAADLLMLKRFAAEVATDDVVGFYSSAQLVALVPYSLVTSVSMFAFPLIASVSAAGDRERMRRYVSETVRVTCLLLVLMASVAWAAAPEVQTLLFPAPYGIAAPDLRWLVWGYSGYSLTITTAWIFNSHARSRVALLLVGVVLLCVVLASAWWVPLDGDLGAARAVALAGGVGSLVSLLALRLVFGAALAWSFAAKLGMAVALVAAVGHAFQAAETATILLKLAAATGVFLAAVFATRAVTITQLRELRWVD